MLSKQNIANILPLTPLQQGMLYHDLVERDQSTSNRPSTRSYFQQMDFRISGPLDKDAFEYAWRELIKRHSVLRSVFKHDKTREPIQIVLKNRDFRVAYYDFSTCGEKQGEQGRQELINSERENAFDLERDLLLRISLIKYSDYKHWVIWSFHHILMDGWCIAPLQRELFHLYSSYQRKETAPLPALPPAPCYGEYVQWYHHQENHLPYWLGYLQGYRQEIELPIPKKNRLKPANDLCQDTVELMFDPDLSQRLSHLGQSCGVSASTLFHTLWGLMLAKSNQCHDVVFGTVQSIRPKAITNINNLIGLCINTLPFRVSFDPEESFESLIKKIQDEMLACLEHGVTALSEIQSHFDSQVQLCNHFIAFENYPSARRSGVEMLTDDLKADCLTVYMPTSYDFHIAAHGGKNWVIDFKYCPRNISRSAIKMLADRFHVLCDNITAQPTRPISFWSLLQPEERQHQLKHWAWGKEVKAPAGGLVSFFRRNTRDQSECSALTFSDQRYSHGQFDQLSNLLANILREKWITDGRSVVLLGGASPELVVAMFSCLKLNIPFIPLDPGTPGGRIESILSIASPQLILGNLADAPISLNTDVPRYHFSLDSLAKTIPATSPLRGLVNTETEPDNNTLAYIIFTSGTTGEPKGVPVTQKALANYIQWLRDRFELSNRDSSLLLTSFSFDLGYTAIFGTLALGGHLHLATEAQRRDPEWVSEYLATRIISFIKTTPSYLHMLMQCAGTEKLAAADALNCIISGGEELILGDLQKITQVRPEIRLYNHYGPTEATIGCCAKRLTASDLNPNSEQVIGQPAHNSFIGVCGADLQLLPQNVCGELLIAGKQLTSGYLGNDANNNQFVEVPWMPSTPCYRSGDRGYRREDGELVFLGRDQNQCKIDGYRVDLRHVESTLKGCPWLVDALVTTVHLNDGHQVLLALVIIDANASHVLRNRLGSGHLRDWLGHHLPRYMLPSEFIEVSRFPLTENGKIDREMLAQYRSRQRRNPALIPSTRPFTALQDELHRVWSTILFRDDFGIDEDFFSLGGHSIKAIRCIAEINKRLHRKLTLNVFLTHSTIRQLSMKMESPEGKKSETQQQITPGASDQSSPIESTALLSLATSSSPEFTLYMLPPSIGTSTVYKELLQELPMEFDAFGFQCGGFSSNRALDQSLEQMASRAVELISMHYGTIPSSRAANCKAILGGHSMGGVMALECARQLQQRGIQMPLLLLDSSVNLQRNETTYSLETLKTKPYWRKIVETMQSSLSTTELNQIEQGAQHCQMLLGDYRSRFISIWKNFTINSPIIAIEAMSTETDAERIQLQGLTKHDFKFIKTSGDHFSMFQPPHMATLVEHISENLLRLVTKGR